MKRTLIQRIYEAIIGERYARMRQIKRCRLRRSRFRSMREWVKLNVKITFGENEK